MNGITRMALPVPATGTALGDPGDEYVESLSVEILVDGKPLTTVTGPQFEQIMSSIRVRHLAFHPRTRALTPGSMKAPSFAGRVDRHWSSIDSMAAETAGLAELADSLATAARGAETIAWNQAN